MLAEKMTVASVKGNSSIELLIEERVKNIMVNTNKGVEQLKAMLEVMDNNIKRLIERMNSHERILIDVQKEFLQHNTENTSIDKGKSGDISRNATSGKPSNNGVNTPLSRQLTTFNLETFTKQYLYKVHPDLVTLVNKTIQSNPTDIKSFQDLFEGLAKTTIDGGIRKVVPGIAKTKFWDSMRKALTFHRVDFTTNKDNKEDTTKVDKTPFIALLHCLSPYDIKAKAIEDMIKVIKPKIDSSEVDKDNLLLSENVIHILEDIFKLDTSHVNQVWLTKVKMYLSKLLVS